MQSRPYRLVCTHERARTYIDIPTHIYIHRYVGAKVSPYDDTHESPRQSEPPHEKHTRTHRERQIPTEHVRRHVKQGTGVMTGQSGHLHPCTREAMLSTVSLGSERLQKLGAYEKRRRSGLCYQGGRSISLRHRPRTWQHSRLSRRGSEFQ